MKKKNLIANGFFALAAIAVFTQCDNNKGTTANTGNVTPVEGVSDIKIAYVEIDSLLTQYDFCKDLNETMMRKQENVNATLNEKMKALDSEVREYERKYNNHVFTPERAQQEQTRLLKMRQDLEAQHQRLMAELQQESDKNNMQLRDSINSFLKEYNKAKGYSLILSNTGADNLLYADPALNITKEIIEGLNKRYVPAERK